MNEYINLVKFDTGNNLVCEEHGAMLCVNKDRSIWRCPVCNIGISLGSVESGEALMAKIQTKREDLAWKHRFDKIATFLDISFELMSLLQEELKGKVLVTKGVPG